MASMMMCGSRLASTGAGARWRAPFPRTLPTCAPELHRVSSAISLKPRNRTCALGFTIRAVGSDFNDPERLSSDEFFPDAQYSYSGNVSGGSESEGEPFSQTTGSVTAKLDATSQLSESVPSASVEQLEGDGGDSGNVGPRGGGSGDGDGFEPEDKGKKKLSASQKLTLAYAILIAVGGIMGFAKSRSMMSLVSGAVSTGILYYVYTQLPTNPVFASSLGLGVSALLLALMGARFMNSGKLFPAGVVSLVSLIMTGGYIHGIIRSSHK